MQALSRWRVWFVSGLFVLAACSPAEEEPQAVDPTPAPGDTTAAAPADPVAVTPADYVFTNAKVYTVDPEQEWAEAIAVQGNEIVYVGAASGAAAFQGEGTESIDLAGKMVVPGFVSGHDHLIAARWVAYGADLSAAKSKDDYVDGSRTVRNMVDAIEAARKAGYADIRNQLSHLFWTHPDDLERIFELDIPVNVTPNFSTDWSNQDEIAREYLGDERIREQLSKYPEVANNGNKLSISADIPSAPIEHIGPLFQIETAMTLQDPTNPDSKVFPAGRTGLTLEQAI